jgi:predicted nucleic acid-binding protein
VNVVDSSGWLEYPADGPNADFFASAVEDVSRLVVPTICLLEVFKRVLQQRGENDALQAAALMQQGEVVDLDAGLALAAARLGLELKLPLADSVVFATACARDATLWTQDSDFEGLEGVRYVKRV